MWKRISAFLLDFILLGIAVAGMAALLSAVLDFDKHNTALDEAYAVYEAEYGIVFDITEEEYIKMSEAELQAWNDAYNALIKDEEAMYSYNMVVNLTLVISTLAILLAYLVLEFAVPIKLGNGQTLGKKIFGIAVMRIDGVKLTPLQLFVRTVLGKYTVETMIPVMLILMIYFNFIGNFVPPHFGEVELSPEEQEEQRKREELRARLHQNYLKRKANGKQKQYEENRKEKRRAEIAAMKQAIREEDMANGVFVMSYDLPKLEPKVAGIRESS